MIAHTLSPNATSRAIFSYFLEKIYVRIEEKRQSRYKLINFQTSRDTSIYIGKTISQGKGKFLNRSGPGFPNVITADGYSIPAWYIACAVHHHVLDKLYGWSGWKQISFLGNILLKYVVLQGAI